MSSEVSSLKTNLDLLRAELETERKSHQKEEKALRARVVEVEKQRDTVAQELEKQKDAAIREASKNSEAMKSLEAVKKECKGILGSFCFFQYSNLSLLLTCCLVSCPAL